ncbi:hypothetical protein C3K47_09875 [Solitalea longa]|uniref:Uncharacterized protein n=1 Tax=Solitalea longa TaxID=2079460 RepID=A0A2S5A242_9SPHI|nr:hypothetical protein [Solitalea longa]POY36668.1 hypothetical protein C3K47_09875 [Solitalea longa]
MKQTLLIPAVACLFSLITGTCLKFFELPGANMLILLSSVLLMGLILLFTYSLIKVASEAEKIK